MILDDQKLLNILKSNPAKARLDKAREKSSLLDMHITGRNMKDQITSMDYFEDEQKKQLRQKYARSNKDLFGRIHRPIDKIWNAKGGSIVYNMPDTSQKQFSTYLSDIRNGMGVRKWVQQVALPAFQIDPNGLIFMELDDDGNPYPTYKSTNDIYDYKLNGRRLEYVIFRLTMDDVKKYIDQGITLGYVQSGIMDRMLQENKNKQARYYRIVDDTSDKIVEWQQGTDTFEPIEGLTVLNPWLQVPALIVSDIVYFNSDLFLSPDEIIVELANDFLTDCSVFNIWKKLHGFPKAWRFASICPTCMGTTLNGGVKCKDCDGTGKKKRSNVRDELIIPLPETGQQLPKDFAGYITPNIEGWKLMTEEMDRLHYLMFETIWGTVPQKPDQSSKDQTATAKYIDTQAMNDRLKDFSEWAQAIEAFIIDSCGQIMYGASYKGVSDIYGNRYLVEGPDVIWQKYSDARSKGSPQATLDGLLRDYYESRYQGSPMDLAKALKLIKVEPWTHLTIAQVEMMSITDEDRAAKTYFSEWLSTVDDMDIIMGDAVDLRANLYEWVKPKVATISQEAQAEANLQATKQLTERVTT